jgi:Flp pilus assembly protein TadG
MGRITGRNPGSGSAERGAVATVVAVLLAGGVLLGSLALVVDVGQLYVEREELQSGADAAALAVAKACATGGEDCASVTAIGATAQRYADANAADGVSDVVDVCGRLPGKLLDCSAGSGNLTDCLGDVPQSPQPYVEVRLATELPDSRFALPPTFAQALSGNAGFSGVGVGACARATWEQSGSHVLDLTISTCEFNNETNDGREFAPPPPYPPNPPPSDEAVVGLRSGEEDGEDGCADPPGAYWHRPGMAGFLTGGGTACEIALPGNSEIWGSYLQPPSFQPPANCEARLRQARTNREVVYLPVHDGIHNSSGATQFRVVYLVPFVVTGFSFDKGHITGHSAPSWLRSPPSVPCHSGGGGHEDEGDHNPGQCVSGLFVGPPVALDAVNVRLVG